MEQNAVIDTQNSRDLNRFVEAQRTFYDDVIAELNSGKKQSCWMWFIFPQVAGLGLSSTSQYYAIRDIFEATLYMQHPVLGYRLRQCAEIVLATSGLTAVQIFGKDAQKLKSNMTLFEAVSSDDAVFGAVLQKYFDGQRDDLTLELLERINK
jgi:uncharacterized protein (DUF1810 family)